MVRRLAASGNGHGRLDCGTGPRGPVVATCHGLARGTVSWLSKVASGFVDLIVDVNPGFNEG